MQIKIEIPLKIISHSYLKKIIPVLISSWIYNMQDLDFMFPFSIRYFLKTKELLKDEKKCMFLSEYKTQCFYVWKNILTITNFRRYFQRSSRTKNSLKVPSSSVKYNTQSYFQRTVFCPNTEIFELRIQCCFSVKVTR